MKTTLLLVNLALAYSSTSLRSPSATSGGVIAPTIIIPGTGGNKLEAKLDKKSVPHFYCSKKADWFTLWLSITSLAPGVIDCWADNIKLVYNDATDKWENTEGVETRVPGWGTTTGFDDLSGLGIATYFKNMSDRLVKEGLVRGTSLRGAPYDFRHTPTDEWLANMKQLVEDTYSGNGNVKVNLISHSMGCLYTLHFLNTMDAAWKDAHINLWMPMAGVWHGSTNEIALMASGNNEGIITVKPLSLREEQRSYESNYWMMPHPDSWSPTEPLAFIGDTAYSAHDYEAYYSAIGYPKGWAYYNKYNHLTGPLTPPGVDVHAIYSHVVDTPKTYYWATADTSVPPSKTDMGDGDGTVPLQSLLAIKKWDGNNNSKGFDITEFQKIDHRGVVANDGVIDHVVAVLKGAGVARATETLSIE